MDRFFGLDNPAHADEGLTLVGTYFDNATLSVALSILNEADIPYLQKERGAGGAVRILAGYNMFGTDVFVREEDAETALDLLTPEDGEEAPEEPGTEVAASGNGSEEE